jgi:iron(III) transport system ATP-binding protein
VQTPPPRLEIRNLKRSYDGRRVVDDVSLKVMPGQVTCLLGPSGCGKSTTLRMIAGVEMQDSGEIHVDGKLICDTVFRIPPERRQIGLMFQDFALFPHLSVAENVAFGLRTSRPEKRARVLELLERVHLSHHIDAFPHELSGGEQQRVALARALAPRPRIMLMDEPFSGLDNRLRDGIRDQTLDILREEDTSPTRRCAWPIRSRSCATGASCSRARPTMSTTRRWIAARWRSSPRSTSFAAPCATR